MAGVVFQPLTPIDWDGTTAPTGDPMVIRMYDDIWSNSGGADHVELRTIAINFTTNTITPSAAINLNTAAFNSFFCSSFNCLAQPSPGPLLDNQAEYINFRSQYRNFGTHESVVCAFGVNVDGTNNGRSGIRWMELRKIGAGAWSIYQQGTYAPADGLSRFVASIAIDAFNNIALGYNVVNSTTKFYSARVTGRLVSDALGTMTFDELEFATGTHATLSSRTGDYYSVSVDPADGKTFWFTSHYAKTGTNWGTKIIAFKLEPDCTIPAIASYTVCQNATVPVGEGLVFPTALRNEVSSSIISGTTYRRGIGNNVTTYTASGVGTAVFYKTISFIAPTSGDITLATIAASLAPGAADDTYLTLYQTSFDPASPATNFLRGDDDSGANQLSSLTHTLTAGTTYIVVVSTFANGVTGTFTLQASTAVFEQSVNWYLNASGGSPLATGRVFNPVGVLGSGITNTATPGSTTFYVADAVFPDCRSAAVFTVGISVGGSVTADATVCTGSNSGTLTLAGHTGTILRWESSIDNFATIVTIANTTTSQSYTNLTQTTKYRAVVQNGVCAEATPATITVTSATVAGAVTADATVCTGSNSGTLTLAGHTGTILRWESSIDNFTTLVPIANTTTSQSYTNLTQTTKYRAVVQNGACAAANSSPATITVTSATVAGTVTADATVCTGSNSGTLTLAGHTGTILRWESSIDNFATIVPIANTTTSQSYTNLTQTTKYRAVVQNGACAEANSSPATITVMPLPSASNTGPYLIGQTISLNASAGTSYSWTGPNLFSSNVSNPTIVNAQNFNAGIYTVTVSNLGCTATATTNVIITGVDPCVQIMTYSYVQAGDPFQTLFPLTNGQKIAKNINQTSIIVKPICPSIPIESVQMNIKGPYDLDWTTLQSYPHFSLYDNAGEYVLGSNLAAGSYTLTVTGYGQKFGYGGTTYGPVVTTFTIVENPPTISAPTLEGTAFCANSNVTISFTTSGTFAPGNTFNVLLSDENGSFNNSPAIIGTTNIAGSVNCTFPSTLLGGENYKVKVISTEVAVSGSNNLSALTLHPLVVNLVSPANDYPSGTITKQAAQFINARNTISGVSNVQYKAGNAINLTPGFQVVSSPSSSFKVNIGGCN